MRIRTDFSGISIIRWQGKKDRFVEIATTRPETLLGDTAVAVNPDDDRYTSSGGQDAEAAPDGPGDSGDRGCLCG